MKRDFGEIIGERQLHRNNGPRRRITTVTLGKPQRKQDGDWGCAFRITGLGIQYGYGVDALQALATALEGIRVILERSGQQFSWLGGEIGYTGFDRLVPSSLGAKFNARLNQKIDREIAQFVDGLKRIHQKKVKMSHRRLG